MCETMPKKGDKVCNQYFSFLTSRTNDGGRDFADGYTLLLGQAWDNISKYARCIRPIWQKKYDWCNFYCSMCNHSGGFLLADNTLRTVTLECLDTGLYGSRVTVLITSVYFDWEFCSALRSASISPYPIKAFMGNLRLSAPGEICYSTHIN